MRKPRPRSEPNLAALAALGDAFVAAAPVHEPTAAERAAHAPVVAIREPAGHGPLTNLRVYLYGVVGLLALLLNSIALDRLGL